MTDPNLPHPNLHIQENSPGFRGNLRPDELVNNVAEGQLKCKLSKGYRSAEMDNEGVAESGSHSTEPPGSCTTSSVATLDPGQTWTEELSTAA